MSYSGFILRAEQRDSGDADSHHENVFPDDQPHKWSRPTFAELFNESACFQAIRETVLSPELARHSPKEPKPEAFLRGYVWHDVHAALRQAAQLHKMTE